MPRRATIFSFFPSLSPHPLNGWPYPAFNTVHPEALPSCTVLPRKSVALPRGPMLPSPGCTATSTPTDQALTVKNHLKHCRCPSSALQCPLLSMSKSSMPAVVHVTSKSSRMPADSSRLSLRLSPRLYLGQLVPGDDAGHGRTSCGCGGCWERMRGVEAQITARYTVACVAAVVSAHALRRPSPALTPFPTTCPPVHARTCATPQTTQVHRCGVAGGSASARSARSLPWVRRARPLPHPADAATDDAGAPPWRSWSECAFSVQVFLVCTALVPSPALTREEDGRRRAPLEWQVRGYSHVRCAPVPIPVPILHLFCALMRTRIERARR
ncbi:hypothetical protein GGX14DRAFT_564923 [Mycena pura]|uniref:Uncharacterized protein n=1 Tax=Mycena pura TaxID=153505 RepID=A0AAD6YBE7_9AGAR|nr:hypothetical protein GGX14DRAFT_564923 [Mycena pura]